MAITPEMNELKLRLRTTWMAGDYGYFARYLERGALDFLGRLAITPGTRMLDVGCGAGQIAIPAARAGARVTGIDIAANLIEQARDRARAEGVDAQFEEGDAEMLPSEDGAFDLVVSLIGAMFAPRPDCVAAELVRTCRPGGRIAMANWTPGGFVGQMFKTVAKYVPPSPLMASPVQWGVEDIVRERLGDGVSELSLSKRLYPLSYPFGPSDVVEFFRTYYGPINRAFAALDDAQQASLTDDLKHLWAEHNTADAGKTAVEGEYLEVIATRN